MWESEAQWVRGECQGCCSLSSGRHVSTPLGICPHDSSYCAVWALQVWGRGGGQGQPRQRKRRGTKNTDVRGDRVGAVVNVHIVCG